MTQKEYLDLVFFKIREDTGIADVSERDDNTYVIILNDEKGHDLLKMLDAVGMHKWLIFGLNKFKNTMIHNKFDFIYSCSYWNTRGTYTRDIKFNDIDFELLENRESKVSHICLKVNRSRNPH